MAKTAGQDDTTWHRAVDLYAAGDRRGATSLLVKTPTADVIRSSARAYEAWRIPAGTGSDAEARTTVIRRLQVSALMPMDVLLTGGLLSTDRTDALVAAAREAWRRLAAFDDERGGQQASHVQRFRVWWRLAALQQLMTVGRFDLIRREADASRPPDADVQAGATLALLRGVALETRARLADEAPSGTAAVALRRLPQASRLGPMNLAMDEAAQAYRRGLDLAPGDPELSLRLARVALERQRLDEADRLLAPLRLASCGEPICGLAYLFTGEVHEARQHLDQATAAYARASSSPTVRPAALMAMIQLALRRGNATTAFDLTRQFSTPAAVVALQQPDAWAKYASGYLMDNGRILERLAEAVVR